MFQRAMVGYQELAYALKVNAALLKYTFIEYH